jgi:transposase
MRDVRVVPSNEAVEKASLYAGVEWCGRQPRAVAERAAIPEPWSQGQVNGHVHRRKLVQRTMYGHAGFALLRRRVLAA